ncbi:hypothetical protein [Streptomyces canus]|uniref:hypothetical protein n=1 Tax=Streptomyces canus TaxID=58343 RepID=UPI00225236F2|nr:hypothetical protein [Streptomyces canus]MCX4858937.1 hypothetical protein [Streptomyces canus]
MHAAPQRPPGRVPRPYAGSAGHAARAAEVAKPRAEPAESPPAVDAADGKAVGHATVPSDGSRSATEPGCTRSDDRA